MKNQRKTRNLRRILFTVGIGLLLVACIFYGPTLLNIAESNKAYDELREQVVQMPTEAPEPTVKQEETIDKATLPPKATEALKSPEQLRAEELSILYPCVEVDHETLLKQNSDYIGWIYIPGTVISYPVCQGETNQEYLHKGFTGGYSANGTIFLDRRNDSILDSHTILYGHNMRSGAMFCYIKEYQDPDWAREHPVFWFITKDNQKLLFEVFSCAVVLPTDKVIYYSFMDADDTVEKQNMIDYMLSKSVIDLEVSLIPQNSVMTISTCMNNNTYRCAVSATLVWVFN